MSTTTDFPCCEASAGEMTEVTITVGSTTDSPQTVTMLSRDRDVSDAAMSASYERLAACLTCGGALTRTWGGWGHARKPERRHVVRVAE